ncbi:hypothetical protein ACFX2I_047301 [Malus domestica]
MNVVARSAWNVLKRSSQGVESVTQLGYHRHEQLRGIRVKVMNGNLEWALTVMQRKMTSSGIERMIKREQTHHLKNSEKRILARKNLEQKLRSQDLARKLKAVLLKKVRQGSTAQTKQGPSLHKVIMMSMERPVRTSFELILDGLLFVLEFHLTA